MSEWHSTSMAEYAESILNRNRQYSIFMASVCVLIGTVIILAPSFFIWWFIGSMIFIFAIISSFARKTIDFISLIFGGLILLLPVYFITILMWYLILAGIFAIFIYMLFAKVDAITTKIKAMVFNGILGLGAGISFFIYPTSPSLYLIYALYEIIGGILLLIVYWRE